MKFKLICTTLLVFSTLSFASKIESPFSYIEKDRLEYVWNDITMVLSISENSYPLVRFRQVQKPDGPLEKITATCYPSTEAGKVVCVQDGDLSRFTLYTADNGKTVQFKGFLLGEDLNAELDSLEDELTFAR